MYIILIVEITHSLCKQPVLLHLLKTIHRFNIHVLGSKYLFMIVQNIMKSHPTPDGIDE